MDESQVEIISSSICSNVAILDEVLSEIVTDYSTLSVYGMEGNEGRIIELMTHFVLEDMSTVIYNMVDEYGVLSYANIAAKFELSLDFVHKYFTDSDNTNNTKVFTIDNAQLQGKLFVCTQLLDACYDHILSLLKEVEEPLLLTQALVESQLSICNRENEQVISSYFKSYVSDVVTDMCKEGLLKGSVRGGGTE